MSTVSYIPKTMEELGEALGKLTANSIILAGGTDLVLRLHSKHLQPDVLLSLSDIPELQKIEITEESAYIGAMATMTRIHDALNGLADLQALADAAGGVGSPQIRNKGTIGGNVANASPAADTPAALWILGAQVHIMGPGGARRSMPVQAFTVDSRKTALQPGEIVIGFSIDRAALRGWRSVFVKLGHRSQVTISRIGLAMALLQDETGTILDARVVAGAIKPIPFQLTEAEAMLRGSKPDTSLAPAIGETFRPHTRRAYKAAAAKGVVEDVLNRF